ncbi:MAG: TetR/AcrR family transcriptional regulator [Rhodomicrobiaceae bacterium]
MPWEKNFDLDIATDKAIQVFWKKGYEGTSMSDLIDAMGINKGSLYNAFGSKDELFNRALLRYDQLNRQEALKQLSKQEDPKQVIATFFDGMISETREDQEHKGCFLVNTALDLPNQSDEIKKMVSAALKELEDFFVTIIKKGQKVGTIETTKNAKEIAVSMVALIVGLRVLARGTYKSKNLEAIKAQALHLLS